MPNTTTATDRASLGDSISTELRWPTERTVTYVLCTPESVEFANDELLPNPDRGWRISARAAAQVQREKEAG